MMHDVKTNITLDRRSKRKDGTHPIKLQVNFYNQRKYYKLAFEFQGKQITSLKEATYEKLNKDNPREPFKSLKLQLSEIESQAHRVIKELTVFSFDEFEKLFYKKEVRGNVFDFFDKIILRKESQQKLRTADLYKCSKSFVQKYHKNPDLTFDGITYAFLVGLENFAHQEGLSVNGFSAYIRTFKALYNAYYKEYDIVPKSHAFLKYKVKNVRPEKRALTIDQIKRIAELDCEEDSDLYEARQIFILSYLLMGINYNDLVQIKWEQIKEGRIYWRRQKTDEPLSVKVNEKIQEILNYFRKKYPESATILPVLEDDLLPNTAKNRIKKALKLYNKQLKTISEKLDLGVKLTSYYARHSYATKLLRDGQPVALISQGLGHRNIQTTENYLSGFDKSELDKANENLL